MAGSLKTLGWETRLTAYLRECSASAFRPGTLDCGMFTAGAVEVMTNTSVTEGLNYQTIEAGMKAMRERGFADHVEYAASLFPELSSPLFAQRGDIVSLEDAEGNPALGVVQGEAVYVMGLEGLGMRPLTDAKRAFRV